MAVGTLEEIENYGLVSVDMQTKLKLLLTTEAIELIKNVIAEGKQDVNVLLGSRFQADSEESAAKTERKESIYNLRGSTSTKVVVTKNRSGNKARDKMDTVNASLAKCKKSLVASQNRLRDVEREKEAAARLHSKEVLDLNTKVNELQSELATSQKEVNDAKAKLLSITQEKSSLLSQIDSHAAGRMAVAQASRPNHPNKPLITLITRTNPDHSNYLNNHNHPNSPIYHNHPHSKRRRRKLPTQRMRN